MTWRGLVSTVTVVALATALAACGDSTEERRGVAREPDVISRTTQVQIIRDGPSSRAVAFDPAAIYDRVGPGVVTIFSTFDDDAETTSAEGSGFVISDRGEVVTNAHVVTDGEGADISAADEVYVRFADRNQVAAEIVGFDPNADIALLQIPAAGLTLRPLPFGNPEKVRVGDSVVAIGSPYGEPQSLSVGVISAMDRTIPSLTDFRLTGALQTDAAINSGNSGGPLVDARGRVIGVSSQIQSTGGGSEGVGYAVGVAAVRRSVAGLRVDGRVRYPLLGAETASVYPQLAQRFDLGVTQGAWVQRVRDDGPADQAGIREGDDSVDFQTGEYRTGGDVIVALDGEPVATPTDIGTILQGRRPQQVVRVTVVRDGERRTFSVRLGQRRAEAE